MEYIRKLLKGKKFKQDDLIPIVVLAIGSHGGIADKSDVDTQIYEVLKDEFSEKIYQETVSHDVPRWRHDIAWAKERAKQIHGYVKSADESGRGIWELTQKGQEYYDEIVQQLNKSTILRKRKASNQSSNIKEP